MRPHKPSRTPDPTAAQPTSAVAYTIFGARLRRILGVADEATDDQVLCEVERRVLATNHDVELRAIDEALCLYPDSGETRVERIHRIYDDALRAKT